MQVMHIGKTLNARYKMEIFTSPGSFIELSEVNFEKDLGIWTTTSLKLSLYYEKAAANATKFLGMLKKHFQLCLKSYLSSCIRLM